MADPIRHRPDCDRPTGPTGTEAACDCAMYQGQFPPPDGYVAPEPNERERELARNLVEVDAAESLEGARALPITEIALLLACYREELRRG